MSYDQVPLQSQAYSLNDDIPVAQRVSDGIAPMKPEPPSDHEESRYKDSWAAVLYVCNIISVTAIGFALGLGKLKDTDSGEGSGSGTPTDDDDANSDDDAFEKGGNRMLLACFIVLATASGLCYIWINAMIRYAATFIRGSILFSAVTCVVAGVVLISAVPVMGIVYFFFAAVTLCYYHAVRDRIPFASANLVTACKAVEQNRASIGVAFAAFIPQIMWCLVWMLAVAAATSGSGDDEDSKVTINGNEYEAADCVTKSSNCVGGGGQQQGEEDCDYTCVCTNQYGGSDSEEGECPSTVSLAGLYVFLLLVSFYWGAGVIKNVVHVTTAGAVGTWWFQQGPGSAVGASFKRSVTTSFGSICFGSLLVAILQAVKEMVRKAREDGENGVLMCIAECLLNCLRDLLEYFNHFAFIYVGIYGMDFVTAGKAVFKLFRDRGWTTIINDDLVGNVLSLGAFFVAATTGLVAYALSEAFDMSSGYQIVLIVLGFLGGFVLCLTVMGVIHSAVTTVFVCFAEDPLALRATHPNEFNGLMSAWQQFQPTIMIESGYMLG